MWLEGGAKLKADSETLWGAPPTPLVWGFARREREGAACVCVGLPPSYVASDPRHPGKGVSEKSLQEGRPARPGCGSFGTRPPVALFSRIKVYPGEADEEASAP